jgi:hypothetical protein
MRLAARFIDRTIMAGHFPITALAWLFGVVTLAIPAVIAWRFRRRPVMALMAASERRAAFHHDALAALDHAIAAARAEGRANEADRLVPERAQHVRALKRLAASREFAGTR